MNQVDTLLVVDVDNITLMGADRESPLYPQKHCTGEVKISQVQGPKSCMSLPQNWQPEKPLVRERWTGRTMLIQDND